MVPYNILQTNVNEGFSKFPPGLFELKGGSESIGPAESKVNNNFLERGERHLVAFTVAEVQKKN